MLESLASQIPNILSIDALLAYVVIASGLIASGIVLQKFPSVGVIDLTKVPHEKDRMRRHSLLENRLRRELVGRSKILFVSLKLIQSSFGRLGSAFVRWVTGLEERYEEQIRRAWKSQFSREEKESRVRMMVKQAEDFFTAEEFREAEKKYIEIISLDPKNITAYKGLGQVYMLLKEYDHAKEVLKQVIKLNKKDDDAYARLATVETSLGNFDQAEADLLKSVTINTNLAGHHIDLGKVYVAKGSLEKALREYQEAVKLEPTNPKNLSLVLETAVELKNRTLAQQTLDALKVANPDNQKIGDYQVAINNLEEQIVESTPK
ncbi:MAG TPA: tetratricopeptide repeat protein [Patescibacteria group bacterium]|nr:tetratricopeptide repeat protein [Patescibacteria group bacterium]